MTERLYFICRIKSGTERRSVAEAACRASQVWMPFSFESTRPRKKRKAVVTIRPVINYLFCIATPAERDHLLDARDIFGPVWYIPEHGKQAIAEYQERVEHTFRANMRAYLTDARAFHCQFKAGQTVRLKQDGLHLFLGKFKGVANDGRYQIETEMFGQSVNIKAEPHTVSAECA